MGPTDWNNKAILFIVDIDGKIKFGACEDWENQLAQYKDDYKDEYGDIQIQLLMKTYFDHFWQAELVEQMMKIKLHEHIEPGLHQWMRRTFPSENIMVCCNKVRGVMEGRYNVYKHIHRKGKDRWMFYNRAFENEKANF